MYADKKECYSAAKTIDILMDDDVGCHCHCHQRRRCCCWHLGNNVGRVINKEPILRNPRATHPDRHCIFYLNFVFCCRFLRCGGARKLDLSQIIIKVYKIYILLLYFAVLYIFKRRKKMKCIETFYFIYLFKVFIVRNWWILKNSFAILDISVHSGLFFFKSNIFSEQ